MTRALAGLALLVSLGFVCDRANSDPDSGAIPGPPANCARPYQLCNAPEPCARPGIHLEPECSRIRLGDER